MMSETNWGRAPGESIGISGHKNAYQPGVRIGNWVGTLYARDAPTHAESLKVCMLQLSLQPCTFEAILSASDPLASFDHRFPPLHRRRPMWLLRQHQRGSDVLNPTWVYPQRICSLMAEITTQGIWHLWHRFITPILPHDSMGQTPGIVCTRHIFGAASILTPWFRKTTLTNV